MVRFAVALREERRLVIEFNWRGENRKGWNMNVLRNPLGNQ